MKGRPLLIISIILAVLVIAFFLSNRRTAPISPPSQLPVYNEWRGIAPGESTIEEASSLLGTPESSITDGLITTMMYPSNNQYWKHEVAATGQTVVFIRERIFPPAQTSLTALTSEYSEPRTMLYGPDSQSGINLYVFPQSGVAFVGSEDTDTAYEIWRFPQMDLSSFLTIPQTHEYSTSPRAHD